MKYTKKQFFDDVAKEAKALKKNATKEEIEKLDFRTLNPNHTSRCIYGQMIGNCREDRAVGLITDCCKKFIKNEFADQVNMSAVAKNVNGKKSEHPRSVTFLSSIETYISMPFAKNKNLIDYLKGERRDLVL